MFSDPQRIPDAKLLVSEGCTTLSECLHAIVRFGVNSISGILSLSEVSELAVFGRTVVAGTLAHAIQKRHRTVLWEQDPDVWLPFENVQLRPILAVAFAGLAHILSLVCFLAAASQGSARSHGLLGSASWTRTGSAEAQVILINYFLVQYLSAQGSQLHRSIFSLWWLAISGSMSGTTVLLTISVDLPLSEPRCTQTLATWA